MRVTLGRRASPPGWDTRIDGVPGFVPAHLEAGRPVDGVCPCGVRAVQGRPWCVGCQDGVSMVDRRRTG